MAPEDTPWSPRGDRISHRLSPEEEAAEAAAAAKKAKEGEADAINEDEAWILNRKKSLVMHSGCDPANSERIGLLTNKMPVRILELRTVLDEETKELSVRAYVSTIPGQSAIILVAALNEFNHSVQRFPSVAQYEGESP